MRDFTVVWFGQVVSLMGTAMTGFALTVWAWQTTGSATALALVGLFTFGPTVLFSPIAGALVDRWNRKLVLALSDLASGLSTIVIFILYASGQLQIWHLYVAGAFSGIFQAFQWPAYSAAITLMVPKAQYGRANGMVSLAESGSGILAPVMAGALIAVAGLPAVLIIDIVTFVFAVGAVLIVRIPQPPVTEAGLEGKGSLLQESAYGFRYIFKRRSLLGLQLVFFCGNLMSTFGFTVLAAMLLARTGSNTAVLGGVESAAALGGVAGGLLISAWGGPRRKVHGVLLGWCLNGLLGPLLLGLGQSLPMWLAGAFLGAMVAPLINSSNQAIWMAKVAPDVQGRVFSVRRLIAQITAPLAMLMAGPLADRVFEPAMQPGGSLAPVFGGLVGVGPGAGMGLMLVIAGLLSAAVGLAGYAFPAVRNAERLLPDHDAQPA
jgi:MFS family permease